MNQIYISQHVKRITVILLAVFACFLSLAQQNSFDPAEFLKTANASKTLVTDKTNTLTPDQQHALETKLVALDDSTSTQVSVIIIPTTGGISISEYNQQLGRNWGVGDKRYNNGVILLIAKNDRKLDIAVGYGLEGALSDYTSRHIIDDIIVPRFKGDDYYRGIDDGVDAITAAVKGEYNAPRSKGGDGPSVFQIILIIVVIIVFVSLMSGGESGGGTFMSRRGARPIIWPTGGGGWSGGGGGGWSGGGGGGFGGFGGGSFGGGGASGSW